MNVFNKSHNALLQESVHQDEEDTVEMKPGAQLQPKQKGIPLAMSHFVLAERTLYSSNESLKGTYHH